MTMDTMAVAVALTRNWVRIYTGGLPLDLAEARRAEIASDLWEMEHDRSLPPGFSSGAMALMRLLQGIPSDLAWRLDAASTEEQLLLRRACAVALSATLVLSLWSVPSLLFEPGRDAACATAPVPQFRAQILEQVVRCTGGLFASVPQH